MDIMVLKIMFLTLTGIVTGSIPILPLPDEVDNCNQYETVDGTNYTLVTYPGTNKSCDSECLYTEDDRRPFPGNMCMPDLGENLTHEKTARGPIQFKGCPKESPLILKNRVVAGYVYMGKPHVVPELACNGKRLIRFDKSMEKTSTCFFVGSIIVNHGCTLKFQVRSILYKDPSKWEQFTSGIYPNPIGSLFKQHPVPCVNQAVWTCKQSYQDCTPYDTWGLVYECDNSKSHVPTKFSYEKTIGTTFSTQMKTSFGTSTTFEAEAKATFFKNFEIKMGKSKTRKYDWSQMDTETRSESVTVTVTQTVPAGKILRIEQVVGICGENRVLTKKFRITDS